MRTDIVYDKKYRKIFSQTRYVSLYLREKKTEPYKSFKKRVSNHTTQVQIKRESQFRLLIPSKRLSVSIHHHSTIDLSMLNYTYLTLL